jgi:hypothetical protein
MGAALLVLAPACSDSDPPAARPETPSSESESPSPEPLDARAPEATLLLASDLEEVPVAPEGIVKVSPQELGVTEDPDPRAPCGKRVTLPPQDEGAVAAFTWDSSPRGVLLQSSWELPDGEAARIFDTYRKDIRPGCPPYTTRTPFGKQEVTPTGEIDVQDAEGVRAVAVGLSVSARGRRAYASAAMAQRGTWLTYVVIFSEKPMHDAFVAGSVTAAGNLL